MELDNIPFFIERGQNNIEERHIFCILKHRFLREVIEELGRLFYYNFPIIISRISLDNHIYGVIGISEAIG
jgi:hypothetical protein